MPTDESEVAARLRDIRVDLFGEHGIPVLAGTLNIPAKTWANYEGGVQVTGRLMLQFISISGVEPHWLLTGEGERYRPRPEARISQSNV